MTASNNRTLSRVLIVVALILAAFIGGMSINYFLAGKTKTVKVTDAGEYEKEFFGVCRLLILNTLELTGISESLSIYWIKSGAGKLDSANQVNTVLSFLKSSGRKDILLERNKEIDAGMKKLKDYPSQYKEAYKALEDTYGVYSRFFDSALEPSGSLEAYNKNINELEEQLHNCFKRLSLYTSKTEGDKTQLTASPSTDKPLADKAIKKTVAVPKTLSRPADQAFDAFYGKNIAEVEKILGAAQAEFWASANDNYQKQYKYNGKNITVYYNNDLVTGASQ